MECPLNEEVSAGAVIYKKDPLEYLIMLDRNDNYAFPKGHIEKGETLKEAAKREIKEEVGLDIDIENDFEYKIEYLINEGKTKKIVYYYLAEIKNQEPYINDGEAKEILFLNYEEAYNKCTYDLSKKVLFEANNYLKQL